MRNRIKQTAGLVILAGAAALAGCATQVPSTSEWAISKGFQPTELQGKEYFCRQQPAVTGSNAGKVTCFTRDQLMAARWSGPAPAEGFAYPVSAPPESGYYLSNTVVDAHLSR
jgi:hypothetical protein